MLLLASLPEGASAADFLWRMALCGLGFGFFQTPNNRALLSAAPRARSGAAGGMLSTARLLGQTLGAAGVAVLFHLYPTQGSNVALLTAAGISLFAALVSVARVRGESEPRARSALSVSPCPLLASPRSPPGRS